MKLTGTKTENYFREKLICSHKSLYEDEDKSRILHSLKESHPEMKTAYVLEWIPDQGEDIYIILIDSEVIAKIEVDRFDMTIKPSIEEVSISRYKKNLKKINQIKLLT